MKEELKQTVYLFVASAIDDGKLGRSDIYISGSTTKEEELWLEFVLLPTLLPTLSLTLFFG
jgi:hypothetical protein